MKKIDWKHIDRHALPVVAVVALLASYRLLTTLPASQDLLPRALTSPLWFLVFLVYLIGFAVIWVMIAGFFAIFPWLAVGAIIEAWSNPPPLRELLWLPVYLAMAIVFGIATLAWVIGPFAPSISGYVWDTRLW